MMGHVQSLEAVRRPRRWFGQCVLAAVVTCAAWASLAAPTDAAVFHWVANPVDAFWGTAANWDTGTVPSSSTAEVVFTNSSITTLSINDPDTVRDRSVRSISFSGSDSFWIQVGGVFNLYSADGILVQSGSPGQMIDVNVRPRLAGAHDYHVANHGSGLLDFSRGITPLNADATVVFDGSGDVRVSQFTRRYANQATNLSVVKNGDGTLTITSGLTGKGSPTSTGAPTGTTTINQGTISINAERNLGLDPGGYFTAEGDFVPGTFDPAALMLNGGTLRATATFAIEDGNRGVTLGPNGGTFEVPTAAHTLTVANVITGDGSLTKTGAGTLALSAANTYSGDTRPAEGALLLSHAEALAGSTLDMAAGDTGVVTFGAGAAFTLGGLRGSRDLNMGSKTLSIGVNDQNTEYSGALSSGTLTKVGEGVLNLSGASTYTGPTNVAEGTLVVNSSIAASSGILVHAGAALQGHGRVPVIGGSGLVSPGGSAGILTAPSIDPALGLGFAFEFGRVGSPDYADAADPVNDVLRLTEPTSPFAAALGAGNSIDIYLSVTDLSWGMTFRGGFYTDREEGFLNEIEGADFDYYVLGDGSGTYEFNGQSYYALNESWPSWTIELATVPDTAAFFEASAAGYVMQLTAVPEPGSLVLVAFALAYWLLRRR